MTQEEGVFFEKFYRDHVQMLVVYAYRFVRNWDDAKEIVQESFITGMVKIDQFFGSENHLGWIKSTVRKKAQNFNKVRKSRAAIMSSLPNPDLVRPANYNNSVIDAPSAHCAELLTEQEFLLFKRIIIEGEPYRDVAKDSGLTEGACRKRIERILVKLRERWDHG